MSHCPTYSGWIPEILGGAHWNPLESSRNLVDFYEKVFSHLCHNSKYDMGIM